MEPLQLTSPAFEEGGWIPKRFSPRGADSSPAFQLWGLAPEVKYLAMTLEDISHPLFPDYAHWVIWNIPAQASIPEGVPAGGTVESLGGAVQGVAYGRHRYKGPKPPLRTVHDYRFTVYGLDGKCPLPASAGKRELLSWMEGHIIQRATLTGRFQSRRPEE